MKLGSMDDRAMPECSCAVTASTCPELQCCRGVWERSTQLDESDESDGWATKEQQREGGRDGEAEVAREPSHSRDVEGVGTTWSRWSRWSRPRRPDRSHDGG